jgi:FkbM family methyltransferase
MDDKTERRSFLVGTLSGVVAGGVGGFFSGRSTRPAASPPKGEIATASPPTVTPSKAGDPTKGLGLDPNSSPRASFAQQGEDLIIRSILDPFKLTRPTYLDIGAHEPIDSNNTYLFYTQGSRGVLVEPNPAFTEKIQKARPGDRVLAVGIGMKDTAEADYYIIRGDGQLNTFSKEQADWLVKKKGPEMLVRSIKVPLVNINLVIAQNFDVAPNLLSVDTEGLDLEILRSLDFARYRPQVICAETLDPETGRPEEDILELLHAKNYSIRGATFVNTIFLANELLARPGKAAPARNGG